MLAFLIIVASIALGIFLASFGHAVAMGAMRVACQRCIPLVHRDRVYAVVDITDQCPPPPQRHPKKPALVVPLRRPEVSQ